MGSDVRSCVGMRCLTGLLLLAGCGLAQAVNGTTSNPGSSGVDLKAIDQNVKPCQNFYQYACGNWMKNNPIPPAYSRWGRFDQLQDRNLEELRTIAEDAEKHEGSSPTAQKVGAFYGACMNEAAVEKAGATPLKP